MASLLDGSDGAVKLLSYLYAFTEKMTAKGVLVADFLRALKDDDFARYLADLFITGMPLPVSQLHARAVLGRNFIGMTELARCFGARFPSARVMQTLGALEFPWPLELLTSPDPWDPKRTIAQTHVAHLGFPGSSDGETFSVRWWAERDFPYESDPPVRWLEGLGGEPAVENISTSLRWYLLRLLPIPLGEEPNLDKVAGPNYYVPPVAEVVTGLLLYLRQTGGAPAYAKLDPTIGLTSNTVVASLGPVPFGAEFQVTWFGGRGGHQLFVSARPWSKRSSLDGYGLYVSRRLPR